MRTLDGQRPLAAVTGASSGIGYELARQFALNGFDLLVAAEDEGVERLGADFAELGCSVEAHQLDLATLEGMRAFQRAIHTQFRPLDAIAINAGVGVCGEFARETALDEELNLIHLNVLCSVQLAKSVLPKMIQRKQGRVLLTSSIAALMPTPFEAVYGASKAFLLSFASSLHAELQGTGVSVTALMPGPSDIESFQCDARPDAAHAAHLAYRAMMAGEERVVADSMQTKLQAAIARFMPESLLAQLSMAHA